MAPLKNYRMPNGKTYQYREGEQPAGAVEVKPKAAAKPANKARRAPANKAAAK